MTPDLTAARTAAQDWLADAKAPSIADRADAPPHLLTARLGHMVGGAEQVIARLLDATYPDDGGGGA